MDLGRGVPLHGRKSTAKHIVIKIVYVMCAFDGTTSKGICGSW